MRIMIGIGHPKQVHIRKNIINNLVEDGHEVKIVTWDKDITSYLLNVYGFKYEIIGKNYKGLMKKAYGMLKSDFKLFKIAKRFKPDILVWGSPYLAHVSKLIGKPHIDFTDTEHAKLATLISFPFSDVICTPSCYRGKIDPKKHVMYNGYEELAYLHPNYFKPDPGVLDDLGLSKEDRFIIIRFVSWRASHDVGQHGFELRKLQIFVKELEKFGKVLITSEAELKKDFEKYKIKVPPEKMHDLLYYATMYIGEGATMASESAILGTPAIYVNTLRLGCLDEKEKRYGLVYNFSNSKTAQKDALAKAVELLEDGNQKSKWQRKREKLLSEKIDVTKFMTDFIENHPESFEKWEVNNPKEVRI